MANPFASFTAGSATTTTTTEDNGWMATRKVGRDDSAIKSAKDNATEKRKSKNRRGSATNAANAGGKKAGGSARGGNKRAATKRKKNDWIDDDDSDEESFQHSETEEEEEEDDFVVGSDDEEEDDVDMNLDDDEEEGEDDWDSGMEDSDSDFGGKKKKKKKEGKGVKSKGGGKKGNTTTTSLSRSERANKRTTTTKTKSSSSSKQQSSSWNSLESEDDIEESSPMPPHRGRGRTNNQRAAAAKKKQLVESPIIALDSEEDADDDDDDDIYASDKKTKQKRQSKLGTGTGGGDSDMVDLSLDTSPTPKKSKPSKSKYFGSTNDSNADDSDFGEEKKQEEEDDDDDDEDENVLNGVRNKKKKATNKKRRAILDDSESDDEDFSPFKVTEGEGGDNDDDHNTSIDLLEDTPKKMRPNLSIDEDDFVDDDEAAAIAAAMEASMDGETKQHKRLKKKKKKKKPSMNSSLEQIKEASPAKEFPKYKDDIESLADSDDDNDDALEDDEVEVYEVDEQEQTAAQVLKEANALSSKIIQIVSGWCGTLDKGNNLKGMILGEESAEGALNVGGSSDAENAKHDATWISNETMKEIMPNVTLAEYQLLGVNWMALLNRCTFGKGNSKISKRKGGMNVNGILADEMGLGKTVQTIAFLAWLNRQNKKDENAEQRPHLIVVPASVLSNWMNEFKKFAPDMLVEKYYGNQAEREIIRQQMDCDYLRGNEPLDAVLTTFSYFSSDSNKGDRSFLRKFEFDYLVVDEGHTLKNPKGLRYQNLNKFQTSHRLLLTGTPVQNSPKELMSLLCFLMPLFDSKTKSKKRGYGNDSDDEDDGGERMLEYFVHLEGGAQDDAAAYRKLKQLFAPFVLRRKKEDVLGQIIPPKTRKVDIVPMDGSTRSAYDEVLSSHVKARADQKKGTKTAVATGQKHLFTALRKAANHPLLLRNRFKSETEKDTLARLALSYNYFGNDASCTLQLVRDELDKHSDYEIHCAALHMIEENPARRHHLEKYTLMVEDLFCSAKFVRLRKLLPELIGKGHRILIFSQWTKILDLMGHLMHHLQMEFLRLDGSTAVSERQDLIDTFNKDASLSVFLLSTRAGGMGLNLTSADVCILHDLDFNPFNDLQAEDRCHRIGQKKPVTIIKMVTQGTVDEDIYSIQERKARMNEAIMEENGKKKKKGDSDEMCRLASAAVERFLKSPQRPMASKKSETVDLSEDIPMKSDVKSDINKEEEKKAGACDDGPGSSSDEKDEAVAEYIKDKVVEEMKANPDSSDKKKETIAEPKKQRAISTFFTKKDEVVKEVKAAKDTSESSKKKRKAAWGSDSDDSSDDEVTRRLAQKNKRAREQEAIEIE